MSSTKRTDHRLVLNAFYLTFLFFGAAPNALAADAGLAEQTPEPPFDQERFNNEKPKSNWSLIVGAGASYEPDYEGSDDFEIDPIPVIVFTYGDWLEIDPRGIAVTALRHEGFALAARVGYESGRDEDDNDRLDGLGDIDFAATVGAKASYTWNGFEFYGTIDQTIDGSESLIGTVGTEYKAPVTERLILGAGVEAVIANDKHMEAYFGVNAAQSARSGLPEYKAEAGLKRVNVSASATYMLSENWLVRGETSLGILTGDAADSPIVEEKLQPSASLFVGYKF
ncbi:outer membrane scaffolding protein for murein synthesis (MipA/OmpV family) [Rhizobium petrolearium]|uniref:MipA/OmpV family protein n=1 Tax=Neorhizobium petrolearium TaxID=515361 RepID=UPI001AE8BB73|nr:MipA/OmpV family protein [Neorhizobium petrolearium]MBP1848529.1 outer membrane scaffolding protein for murein synthesis (MipA/OmpV family) [Neorhizobium petrolearium]